ncbi:hypothetical protein Pmar_PMAR011467, partial [Perkinsus marinus ATCC 50983]
SYTRIPIRPAREIHRVQHEGQGSLEGGRGSCERRQHIAIINVGESGTQGVDT